MGKRWFTKKYPNFEESNLWFSYLGKRSTLQGCYALIEREREKAKPVELEYRLRKENRKILVFVAVKNSHWG